MSMHDLSMIVVGMAIAANWRDWIWPTICGWLPHHRPVN